MGALTKASAGDITPINTGATITSASITGGNTGTHFQISSAGLLTPTAGGDTADLASGPYALACSYNGGADTAVITVTCGGTDAVSGKNLANCYSVATGAQLATVVALDASLEGKFVLLRGGDYRGAVLNHYGKQASFTTGVTYTAHDHSNLPILDGWYFGAGAGTVGNVVLSWIDMRYPYASLTGPMVTVGNTVNATNVTVDHCLLDCALAYGRTGGTLSGNERYAIGPSGASTITNLTVTNCTFTNLCHAINFIGVGATFTGNEMKYCWGDFLNMNGSRTGADTKNVTVENNCMHDMTANMDELHPDFIQCFENSLASSDGDITDIIVKGNVVFPGVEGVLMSGTADPANQGLLLQDLGAGKKYRRWTIEGNDITVNTVHAVTFEVEGTDVLIGNNTLKRPWVSVHDAGSGWNDYAESSIRIIAGANVVIENNVTEAITITSGSPIQRNNNTSLSRTAISSYTALMQGTTFNPSTRAEALADSRMVANAGLDTDNSGTATIGDIGAVGTTIDNGFYQFTTIGKNSAFNKPILSGLSGSSFAGTTTVSFTTDKRDGTITWVLSLSATPPTSGNILAGQVAGGGAAPAAGSEAVTHYGITTDTVADPAGTTTYYVHAVHVDGGGNTSAVATSASFVTSAAAFTPADLFAASETGFWIDPSDLTTMFQLQAGTAVAADSDPVGKITDKSGNGHVLISNDSTARPLYKVTSTFKNIEFDGSNDFLEDADGVMPLGTFYACFGVLGLATVVSTDNRCYTAYPAAGNDYDRADAMTLLVNDGTYEAAVVAATGVTLFQSKSGATLFAQVIEIVKTPTTCELIVNGVSIVTDSSFAAMNASSAGGFGFATVTNAGTKTRGKWHGRLYGAFKTSRSTSSGERAAMRTWMGNKMGLSL